MYESIHFEYEYWVFFLLYEYMKLTKLAGAKKLHKTLESVDY